MSSEALVTAGSMITLTFKEPEPQGSKVNGERWSESRRDSQPYRAHQIAQRESRCFPTLEIGLKVGSNLHSMEDKIVQIKIKLPARSSVFQSVRCGCSA
jgi:hypothetical protein